MNTQARNASLSFCTRVFKRTMRLSCAHNIEERLVDQKGEEVLKLVDIYSH